MYFRHPAARCGRELGSPPEMWKMPGTAILRSILRSVASVDLFRLSQGLSYECQAEGERAAIV